VRVKALNRDNFRCAFCGKSPATNVGTKLHIDHIVPFSKGGTNAIDNLQTLCEECNLGKSNEELAAEDKINAQGLDE
jgi:5-methylcytosine-specific restriction endonuclease McrA